MQVVTSPDLLEQRPRALAVGTFDGVHVGHRAVIGRALEIAGELSLIHI